MAKKKKSNPHGADKRHDTKKRMHSHLSWRLVFFSCVGGNVVCGFAHGPANIAARRKREDGTKDTTLPERQKCAQIAIDFDAWRHDLRALSLFLFCCRWTRYKRTNRMSTPQPAKARKNACRKRWPIWTFECALAFLSCLAFFVVQAGKVRARPPVCMTKGDGKKRIVYFCLRGGFSRSKKRGQRQGQKKENKRARAHMTGAIGWPFCFWSCKKRRVLFFGVRLCLVSLSIKREQPS